MIIFEDNFETGDTSLWTGTTTAGTSVTQTVEAGAAYAGSYGLKSVMNNASDSNDDKYIYKTGLNMDVNINWGVDFTMQFAAVTQMGYRGNIAKSPIVMLAVDGNDVFWMPTMGEPGVGSGYENQAFARGQLGTNYLTMEIGKWYLFRFEATNINTTANTADLALKYSTDGGLTFQLLSFGKNINWRGAYSATGFIDQIQFGQCHVSQTEKHQYTTYLDNVKVWQYSPPEYQFDKVTKRIYLVQGFQ